MKKKAITLMKTKIYVYPDNCAYPPLWDEQGAHLSVPVYKQNIPNVLLAGLRYRNYFWQEFARHYFYSNSHLYDIEVRKEWYREGQYIVDALNECQDEHQYVYDVVEKHYLNDDEE